MKASSAVESLVTHLRYAEIKFTVKQSGQGSWVVCEGGFEKPLADFDNRDDAIDYARERSSNEAARDCNRGR